MKTELISARLEKEDTKILEEITKEENTDKTSALKKILKLGSKQYRLEKSIKHYQDGRISIGMAADMAGITLWEMMEELKMKNIANPVGKQEYAEGTKNLERVLGKKGRTMSIKNSLGL
ncbi:MAG TPA: UPF0175 family protein [archaeon]|nr:UPF0175 family protein [archaeon]